MEIAIPFVLPRPRNEAQTDPIIKNHTSRIRLKCRNSRKPSPKIQVLSRIGNFEVENYPGTYHLFLSFDFKIFI